MSGASACSGSAFVGLWKALHEPADDQLITEWNARRQGMNRQWFDRASHLGSSHPFDSPLAGEQRAVPPLTAENFRVLNEFNPRFERWWQNGAGEHAVRMQRRLSSHLDNEANRALLTGLARFHRLDRDIPPFEVVLIAAPTGGTRASHAEVRANQARVETIMNERSSQRLGVVVHEAAHYLYARTSNSNRNQVRSWFLDNEAAWSLAAYNLFNEALASAFGNALIDKQNLSDEQYAALLELPESLYADVYVDRAAKAVLPLLDEYLTDNNAIDRAFVDRYIARVGRILGNRMTELPFWLRQMVFATTNVEALPLVQTVAQRVRTGALLQEDLSQGCGERCLLSTFSELGGIVITTPDALSEIENIIPGAVASVIRRRALTTGISIHGIKRSERSLLYVITASTPAGQTLGLERLLDFGSIFTGELESAAGKASDRND